VKYRGKGTFSFTVQPYGHEVHFCYLMDEKEMDRYLKRNFGSGWDDYSGVYSTQHHYNPGFSGSSVTWIRASLSPHYAPDYGTIAHEVHHIVNNICRDCGMPHETENDEPFAYLSGWITEQIYFWLLKKNA